MKIKMILEGVKMLDGLFWEKNRDHGLFFHLEGASEEDWR
jgi:hypothetical protein